ncbi:MAG: hypothetical protein QOG10_3584 [Kribbellaceae bacterium]|nr:hypothetical protein [Kribbellaceae bacterium]
MPGSALRAGNGAATVSRAAQLAGLPETTSSLEQATRRTSGGWTVGAPNGCRDLRVLTRANCSASPGRPSGRARDGVPAVARHTTQGTSAGPADTGKPVGQPLGPPGAQLSARWRLLEGLAAISPWPIRERARRPCRRHNPPSSSAAAGSTRCRRPNWTVNCRNGPPGAPRSRRTPDAPASGTPLARG